MVLIPGQNINFMYKGSSPYASNILSGNAVAIGNFQVNNGTASGTYSNITMYQDATTGIYYINISPEQSPDGNGHTYVSVNYKADAFLTVVSLMTNNSSSNNNSGSNSSSTTSSSTNNNSSSNMISTLTNYFHTYKNIFVIIIAIIILFIIFYRR